MLVLPTYSLVGENCHEKDTFESADIPTKIKTSNLYIYIYTRVCVCVKIRYIHKMILLQQWLVGSVEVH